VACGPDRQKKGGKKKKKAEVTFFFGEKKRKAATFPGCTSMPGPHGGKKEGGEGEERGVKKKTWLGRKKGSGPMSHPS